MSVRPAATLAMMIAITSVLLLSNVSVAAAPVVAWHGSRQVRTVALTIDDGWSPSRCRRMYRTLVAAGVPATWFPNSIYVKRSPALWSLIAAHFPIGNHTVHHLDLTRLPTWAVTRKIARDEQVIEAITRQPMVKVLRPPFGAFDGRVLRAAQGLGYQAVALWDASTADSSPRTSVRTGLRAAARGRPGSIVLMHCGPAITPHILPALIRRYACAGFRFVTVPELLAGDAGVQANVRCRAAHGPTLPIWPGAPSVTPRASPDTPDEDRLLLILITTFESIARQALAR